MYMIRHYDMIGNFKFRHLVDFNYLGIDYFPDCSQCRAWRIGRGAYVSDNVGEVRDVIAFIERDHVSARGLVVVEFGPSAVVGDVGAEIMRGLIFWHGGIGFLGYFEIFGLRPQHSVEDAVRNPRV